MENPIGIETYFHGSYSVLDFGRNSMENPIGIETTQICERPQRGQVVATQWKTR